MSASGFRPSDGSRFHHPIASKPLGRNKFEEIVLRLEHCLDQLLLVVGHQLSGSSSVGIAVYPDGGTTEESLLNAGDPP